MSKPTTGHFLSLIYLTLELSHLFRNCPFWTMNSVCLLFLRQKPCFSYATGTFLHQFKEKGLNFTDKSLVEGKGIIWQTFDAKKVQNQRCFKSKKVRFRKKIKKLMNKYWYYCVEIALWWCKIQFWFQKRSIWCSRPKIDWATAFLVTPPYVRWRKRHFPVCYLPLDRSKKL